MKIITWTHNSAVQSCSCNPYLFQNIFYTGTEKVIDIKEIHWIKGTCWIAQVSRNVGVKCTDTNVLSQYTQKAQYSCHAGKGQNKVKTRRRIKLHLCIKINHFKLVTWRQFKVAGQWWINTNAMQIKTSENIHLSLFETQHEKTLPSEHSSSGDPLLSTRHLKRIPCSLIVALHNNNKNSLLHFLSASTYLGMMLSSLKLHYIMLELDTSVTKTEMKKYPTVLLEKLTCGTLVLCPGAAQPWSACACETGVQY